MTQQTHAALARMIEGFSQEGFQVMLVRVGFDGCHDACPAFRPVLAEGGLVGLKIVHQPFLRHHEERRTEFLGKFHRIAVFDKQVTVANAKWVE